jgi:hypothetical protein
MTTPDDHALTALAAEQIDDVDVVALERIAALYTKLDPVPDNLIDRISFGITLDALHAELANLERSSGLIGVRADETVSDTVTFTSESLSAMISVSLTTADTARIDGWISPGGVYVVELRTPDGTLRTESDADGRFVVEDVARGLVQFTFRAAGGTPVVTPALEI